jgi:hypothetical protein
MNGKNPCPEDDTYDQFPDVLTGCKAVGFTKDVVTFESRVGWVVVDDPKHGQCYFYSMLLGLDKNQDLVKLIPLTCADGRQFVTGTTYKRFRK